MQEVAQSPGGSWMGAKTTMEKANHVKRRRTRKDSINMVTSTMYESSR
jgi:hypothetical protein